MNNRLFIASLIFLGFLFVSPLQAMEIDKMNNGIERTELCRTKRDGYLIQGDLPKAAKWANKVINENSQAPDNPHATIEDFRIARDTYAHLALQNANYLGDAISYAQRVTDLDEALPEDFYITIELCRKAGWDEQVAYYESICGTDKKAY